jgi:hypothetical protein
VNAAEHYREAERLIAAAVDDLGVDTNEEVALTIARAQVHATLALASTPQSSNAYRCIECGAMATTRGDHLPTCSTYVKPWAGTTPDDASSITDVTS